MSNPEHHNAKEYIADRDRALRLLAVCLRSISESEKRKLSSLLMGNIESIGNSRPSAETGLKIITAIGAAVVGELNSRAKLLQQKAAGN